MPTYTTESLLKFLVAEYPKPLRLRHFEVEADEEREFLRQLAELKQRGLIDASLQLSGGLDQHGVLVNAAKVRITKEGREFLEPKKEQAPTTQNITINSSANTINIAGRDINISNDIDAEKFLATLLENIQQSSLHPEEKATISQSFTDAFKATAPGVAVALLMEAVKTTFSGI